MDFANTIGKYSLTYITSEWFFTKHATATFFAIPLEYGTLKNDECDKKNKTEIKRKV